MCKKRGGWTVHGISFEERYWSKVDRSGGEDACWLWTASLGTTGYGQFMVKDADGRYCPVGAHRVAYQLAKGEIPKGMEVLHACDCRQCNNPNHLSLGTHYENMLDSAKKGRSDKKWLSPEAVREIRSLLAAGVRQTDIAKMFGVTYNAIYQIRVGKCHTKEVTPTNTHQATKSAAAPTTELATLS